MSVQNHASTSTAPIINPYEELPHVKRLKLSSASPYIPTFVQNQLAKTGHAAELYAARVKGKQMLLENPPGPARKAKVKREEKKKRIEQARKRKALGVMSLREGKEKGVWTLEKSQTRYELFLPLHQLWLGYMSELLNLPSPTIPPTQAQPNAAMMHAKLVKADFHGSIMTVRQSKNPSIVGVGGIVIHETENAFRVITPKDQVKLLPKQNNVFVFAVPLYSFAPPPFPPAPLDPGNRSSDSTGGTTATPARLSTVLEGPHVEFDLHGNQFRFRAAERAGKKFKHKETIEL